MIFRDRKLFVFAVALLTVPFVPRKEDSGTESKLPPGKTVKVRSGVLESTLRLSGAITAMNAVTLRAPRLPGRRRSGGSRDFSLTLLKLAKPGAEVAKGETVAEFDPQYIRVRLDDQRSDVQQQEANLTRLRADLRVKLEAHQQLLEVAKAELDKAALNLRTTPVRSAIEAEILRLVHEEAEARYERLRAERPLFEISERAAIRVSELELADDRIDARQAEANLDRMKLEAPIAGVVIPQTIFRSGQLAEVGEGDELRPGHAFVNIVDTSSLIVEAKVNQVDVEHLRIGQRARIRLDALPGIELPARITAIGAVATGTRFRPDFMRQIPVQLRLEENHPQIFPNASASADIVVATQDAPAIVPRHCIFQAGDGEPVAFVRTEDGWEARPVVLGLETNVEAAVLDGLVEGEVIAAEAIGAAG